MRTLLTAIFFTLFSQTALGGEIWACDGFLDSGDGSKSPPFLMTKTGEKYSFKIRSLQYKLKRVARSGAGYDIYIDDTKNTFIHGYYIDYETIDTKSIIKFYWDMRRSTTECLRQQ